MQAAGAAVSAAADTARVAAGGAFEQIVRRLQDFMPRRKPAYRRVTPLASRRETQRRAALAFIALLVVVGGLVVTVWAFGGQRPEQAISSFNAGQDALDLAKKNLALVIGPGIDLIQDEPVRAKELLTAAYAALDTAEDAKMSQGLIAPIRTDVIAGLDRLYGVVEVASTPLFNFRPAEGAPAFDLTALVRGPDGAPYVIDSATKTVYRVDLKRKRANAIARDGKEVGNTTMGAPKFLASGGRDLLILDENNVVWRWRPSNDAGKGTTHKVTVNGSTQWGDDVTAIGTFLKDEARGLYSLYVVDPSEQQIRAYAAAADGGGFPARSSGWLATARDVDKMTSLFIDGDIFITEDGVLERFTSGKTDAWEPGSAGDELLRDAPTFSLVAGFGKQRDGTVFAYDQPNARLMAYDKAAGDYLGQYRLSGDANGWQGLRGLYVLPGTEDVPPTVIWLSRSAVLQTILVAAPDDEGASPAPSASARPSGAASARPSVAP
jgi:hypothetical protein